MKKKTAGSKNYMSCRQNWFLNSITSFNIFGANHSLERIFSVSDAELGLIGKMLEIMEKKMNCKVFMENYEKKKIIQKKGKKRMKQFGKVDVPQEAFIALAKNM